MKYPNINDYRIDKVDNPKIINNFKFYDYKNYSKALEKYIKNLEIFLDSINKGKFIIVEDLNFSDYIKINRKSKKAKQFKNLEDASVYCGFNEFKKYIILKLIKNKIR